MARRITIRTMAADTSKYESSSDEEIADSSSVIDSVLKQYDCTSEKFNQLSKTVSFLQDQLRSGKITCLICLSGIKHHSSIWHCKSCYETFHLTCIQRWAKDRIMQQKMYQEDYPNHKKINYNWSCPKCRHDYEPEYVPQKYTCFCGQVEDPSYQEYIVPHSCGQLCKKDLKPLCGHKCMLLCHPGPCPPCPVTVTSACHCGRGTSVTLCSKRDWSCGKICDKLLGCKKHKCSSICHKDVCASCPMKSLQWCMCRNKRVLRSCTEPVWKCEKVCEKRLLCGLHSCQEVCHDSSICGICPLSEPRKCPCGKKEYILACSEPTPTCLDTCGKLLECGIHTCNRRCHRDPCGQCLDTVTKSCRCGSHTKSVQCYKPYYCDSKCKRMKDCGKHHCNRKCCEGQCTPCEKPCGRTLKCGKHKCLSVCHRGQCFPCSETDIVSCACGKTSINVPCGRKRRARPPKCEEPCRVPPSCHHAKRVAHKCHFDSCPPCNQICSKRLSNCNHLCPALCHSAALVNVTNKQIKPSMPWERIAPLLVEKELPCPNCVVPIQIECEGKHEIATFLCFEARPWSCGRECGRLLSCGNHKCSYECHHVEDATDEIEAGTNCEECDTKCIFPRIKGCEHECTLPCHHGACPPCTRLIRIRCHCSLSQIYVECYKWLGDEDKEILQSCGNQCPKVMACGHRCRSNCHSNACPNEDQCMKKVKVFCKCRRIKKDYPCVSVRTRSEECTVDCNEACSTRKTEIEQQQLELEEKMRTEEELKNRKELENYKWLLEGKKKPREKRPRSASTSDTPLIRRYGVMICAVIVIAIIVVIFKSL